MAKTNVFVCKFKNEKCKIPLESGKQIADGLCCCHYKVACLQCKYLKKMCICEENNEYSDDSILSNNVYYINEKEKDDDLDFESKFNNLSEIVTKFLINIECNSLDEANDLFDSYKEDKNEIINLFYENNIYSKEHFFNYINKNIDIDDVITDYNISVYKKDNINKYDYFKSHIIYDSLYNKNILYNSKIVNQNSESSVRILDFNKYKETINNSKKDDEIKDNHILNIKKNVTKNENFLKSASQNIENKNIKFKNIVYKVIEKNNISKTNTFKERFKNNIISFINNMNIYLKDKKIKDAKIKIVNKFISSVNKVILINKIKKFLIKKLDKIRKSSNEYINNTVCNKIIKNSDRFIKTILFETIKNNNRNMIETFSNYYNEFMINKKDDYIKYIRKMYDKNHSRFLRLIEICYLIRNDKELYESNLIFSYYTLSKLHKKNDNYNIFLEILKTKNKEYIK